MVNDTFVIPAQAAGFVSLQGQIAKNANSTLSIPEGMINIGGNGKGFLIAANTSFNPVAAANRDSSFSVLTLGDDIYLYACQQASGIATIIASKNATSPVGYTASTSRKLGGFHVGRIRPISARFDTNYAPLVDIVPNSAWDLQHRPRCNPEGMIEFQPGLWTTIYLCSVVSGTWPSVVFGSRYNAVPVRSNGGYNELDLHRGLHAAGMREPTYEEWLMIAYGAPQGEVSANNLAWTSSGNTGPCNTGYVAKSVSCANAVDTVGNLWERLSSTFDLGGAFSWTTSRVATGNDAVYAQGSVSTAEWRHAVAGGTYNYGAWCGGRTLGLESAPWSTGGQVGARGVCESI